MSIAADRPPPVLTERRLDWRVLVVHTVTFRQARAILSSAGPLAVLVAVQGRLGSVGLIGIAVLATVASLVFSALRWWRFSYLITAAQLVVRQGVIRRSERTIPLDRIRGVDVEAPLLHRIFGISVVRVDAAAGAAGREEAALDAVSVTDAGRLQELLLARRQTGTLAAADASPAAGVAGSPAGAGPGWRGATDPWASASVAAGTRGAAGPPEQVYARLDPRWLLYAPLVGGYLAVPLALGGSLLRDVQSLPLPQPVRDLLQVPEQAGAGRIVANVAVLLLIIVVGALVAGAVANWGFLLVGRGGNLVTQRGLLSRRTVSLEIDRIRGYLLSEGLGIRLVGAARLSALVTGLGDQSRRGQLLPLGPRRVAEAIAAAAVRRFDAPLVAHPRAALGRRLVRATSLPAALALASLSLGAPRVAAVFGVLVLAAATLGTDRYRCLGHAEDPAALAVRSGSLVRRLAVLERRAVVGWRVRQSVFQRRSGLVTLTVCVGAGAGGYDVLDCGTEQGLGLIAAVSPGWADPLGPAA